MNSKLYYLIGIAALIQVVLSDECSWTPEERKLNCCQEDPDEGLDQGMLKKCADEFDLDFPEKPVNFYDPCAEECIWREEGNMNDEHKPDLKKFLHNAKHGKSEHVGEDLKVWINVLETCMKEQDSWTLKEGKCKSGASSAAYCLDAGRYMHCSKWKDTAECNATREKIMKCNDKHLMPPRSVGLTPK